MATPCEKLKKFSPWKIIPRAASLEAYGGYFYFRFITNSLGSVISSMA
jgi:hypothetical protein